MQMTEQKKQKNQDLTVEELRTYPGLEKLTDEQAIHCLNALKELSILVCYAADKNHNSKTYNIDNQRIKCIFADNKTA